MMVNYDPKGHGKEKAVQSAQFEEAEPPQHLRGIVHRYIELKTDDPLPEDYRFHALPDACAYIVFNQLKTDIAGATRLRVASEEFNLGTQFHYINIRFFPGVWQLNQEPLSYGQVTTPYDGRLSLVEVNRELLGLGFDEQQGILTRLVETLIEKKVIRVNSVTQRIMQELEEINTVSDMAAASNVSPRQLQRILKSTTGFVPRDFLKVLRLQKAISGDPTGNYADQSHFIHSFRKATGYTPGTYIKKFDV